MVGTRHPKIKTQIREDLFPRMTRIRGSHYSWVFPRIYLWVPVIDPDSCSALVPAQSPNSDADTLPQGHSLRPRGQTRTWLQALEVSSDEEAEGISEPEVDDKDTHG